MGLFKKLKKLFKNPGKALKKAANPKNLIKKMNPKNLMKNPKDLFGKGKKVRAVKGYTLDQIAAQGGLFSGQTGADYNARRAMKGLGSVATGPQRPLS